MNKKDLGLIHDSFVTALTNGSTTYVELPMAEGTMGLGIRWADATSSATITLETTNELPNVVAYNSTTAGDWFSESTSITGPSASAAGSSMKHLGNIGAARARLKIVCAADSKLRIRVAWKA